jgi:hypothetical protein
MPRKPKLRMLPATQRKSQFLLLSRLRLTLMRLVTTMPNPLPSRKKKRLPPLSTTSLRRPRLKLSMRLRRPSRSTRLRRTRLSMLLRLLKRPTKKLKSTKLPPPLLLPLMRLLRKQLRLMPLKPRPRLRKNKLLMLKPMPRNMLMKRRLKRPKNTTTQPITLHMLTPLALLDPIRNPKKHSE